MGSPEENHRGTEGHGHAVWQDAVWQDVGVASHRWQTIVRSECVGSCTSSYVFVSLAPAGTRWCSSGITAGVRRVESDLTSYGGGWSPLLAGLWKLACQLCIVKPAETQLSGISTEWWLTNGYDLIVALRCLHILNIMVYMWHLGKTGWLLGKARWQLWKNSTHTLTNFQSDSLFRGCYRWCFPQTKSGNSKVIHWLMS